MSGDIAYNQIYDAASQRGQPEQFNNPMELRRRLVAPFQISQADDSEDEEELSSYEMTLNRTILCTFCVILLWSTSLQNAVYLVSDNVPKPSLSAVYDTCYFTWKFVNRQRQDYENCVDSQLRQCDVDFDVADAIEKQRVAVAEEHHANYTRTYTALVQNCTSYQSNLTDLLRQWQSGGQDYRMMYQDSCVGAKRERIASILGDSSDGNTAAITTSSEYSLSSTRRVSKLVTYSKNLNSYNIDYIRNKMSSIKLSIDAITANLSILPPLDPTLNLLTQQMIEMQSCLTLDPILSNECIIQPSMGSIYNTSRIILTSQLMAFRKDVELLELDIERYRRRVVQAIDAANDFYDSIAGARGLANWLVQTANLFGSTKALCGKGSPDWCDFSKMDWFVPTLTLTQIRPLPTVPSMGDLWEQMDGTVGALEDRMDDVTIQVTEQWTDWADGVEMSLDGVDITPNDYDPPNYPGNLSREGDQQQQESDGFLTSLQTSLYNQNRTAESASQRLAQGINATRQSSPSTLLSSLKLSWAAFTPPSSGLATYLTPLLTLSPLLYTLDYLYRVCSTLRIITTFWNRGGVRLPIIDRRSRERAIRARNEGMMKNMAFAMRLIPIIWVQVLVLIIAISLVILTIVEVIIPSYHSYVHVCVHSPYPYPSLTTHATLGNASQTWLGANVYASAYNYAYGGGNGAMSGGVARYNSRVQERCRGEGLRGQYVITLTALQQLNQTYADALDKVIDMSRCVDFATLTPLLLDTCAPLPSSQPPDADALKCPLTVRQRFPPATLSPLLNSVNLTASLNPASCSALGLLYFLPDEGIGMGVSNALTGVMEGGSYNCSSLPPCQLTCPGPDPNLLFRLSHDCSCMVEWAAYSYMAQ
eukprot:gene31415-37974_t